MWKRLKPLTMVMVGTGLTISCASFGLAWLWTLAPPALSNVSTHGRLKTRLLVCPTPGGQRVPLPGSEAAHDKWMTEFFAAPRVRPASGPRGSGSGR
jgi:hypothetical protein